MKDGKFETQAEIWEHLLKGGKVKYINEEIIGLIDGKVHQFFSDGSYSPRDWGFYEPWRFSIYEEPKPKKKVTLYRYTYVLGRGSGDDRENTGRIFQSEFTDCSFREYDDGYGILLKTESKEVEYDDV